MKDAKASGETMSREQAAARLVAMMYVEPGAHRVVPKGQARLLAGGMIFDKAVDLILEVDALRASLTEKDREIERLKADNEATKQLAQDAVGALDASKAREREAVERAEKAEERAEAINAYHALMNHDSAEIGREMAVIGLPNGTRILGCFVKGQIQEIHEAWTGMESTLAAARKALEKRKKTEAEILEAAIDRLVARDDWHTKDIAWHMAFPALFAIIRGEDPSAALNGDSHTAHDVTFQGLRDAILGTPEPPKEDPLN